MGEVKYAFLLSARFNKRTPIFFPSFPSFLPSSTNKLNLVEVPPPYNTSFCQFPSTKYSAQATRATMSDSDSESRDLIHQTEKLSLAIK